MQLPIDLETTVAPTSVIDLSPTPKTPTNWNPIVNAMADAQGVVPGSWSWLQAGPAAFSGSSGAQASYGWNHTHKLTPNYIRAVLANYGHRRCYYTDAPFRQFGYEAAGRPHGWEPEAANELADGSTVYLTDYGPVRVTGPDAEHLWLTPLFALIDDPNPILVDTGMGNQLPSNVVAKFLATLLVSSAVGMVRDKNGDSLQPYPWTYGDRATGRLLHTIVEGFKRGCLLSEDVSTAALFIRDIVLAFYEKSPGIHSFGASRNGRFPLGLFNGLHWIVPVCYDAAQVLLARGVDVWAQRFVALVARWSRWMADMHEVLPVECFRASRVYVDPAFTVDGPHESLAPFIRAEDFDVDLDFLPWAFRAVDIASQLTGNAGLTEARAAIVNAYKDDASKRVWLVDAAGDYVEG